MSKLSGNSIQESPNEKLARFGLLSAKERKNSVKDTINEWSKDITDMEICDVLEKWTFLASKEGLFLAYKTIKGLKNFEHLSKRIKRISIKECNLITLTSVKLLNF